MSPNPNPDPRVVYAERFIQYDESGRPYVKRPVKKVNGDVEYRIRYGDVVDCIECGTTYLKVNSKAMGYCSRSCAKKGKPIRHTKITKKALRERCDKLFSMAIREKGECERCGSTYYPDLQCAHIISRKYLSTRWDWDNAFCLCKGCHYWGHGNPVEWELFVEDKIGPKKHAALKKRALEFLKPDVFTYQAIYERMEVLLEQKSGLPREELYSQYVKRASEKMKEWR